jgi:cell division protein FtsB
MPRAVKHLLGAAILLVTLGVANILPMRERASLRNSVVQAQERLAVLEDENKQLTTQEQLLRSDAEVERIAREEFGLAPVDADVFSLPNLRPDNAERLREFSAVITVEVAPKRTALAKVMDTVVFWD